MDILSVLEDVIRMSTADQCEAYCTGISWGLTRFANSYIHQNVTEDNAELAVRVILGKKMGKAKTNQFTPASLKEVVERAEKIARVQSDILDFVSLPSPTPISSVKGYFKKTAEVTPEERAETVKAAIGQAEDRKIETVSGTYYTGTEEIGVVNSLGIKAHFKGTISTFKINAFKGEGTGVAQYFSRDHETLKPEVLTERACTKALASQKTEQVPLGTYPVVLEEQCVCEILAYLAMMAFGAQAYQEGRSALSGHIGEKIADEKVSIWDDGSDESGFPLPFDVEGVGKQKVEIITKGIAKGVVYDSYYAQKEGRRSTGHAMDTPNASGPGPVNLFLGKGQQTLEELIRDCKKGILVTRVHYTNPMHRLKTVITGMTKDGTFLIENGEVTKALRNMRFTQSVLEALSTTQGISNTQGSVRMEYVKATIFAPALRLGAFTFTGGTLF